MIQGHDPKHPDHPFDPAGRIRSFLVLDAGLMEERVFPLRGPAMIGRSASCLLHLSDPSVSRNHASIHPAGHQFVVKDRGSLNGTFVNGERVDKAVLTSGDVLRVGSVKLRFYQEEGGSGFGELVDTQEMPPPDEDLDSRMATTSRRSRRLVEAISRVPIFSGMSAEQILRMSQSGRLAIVERGMIIFHQGDRGRSLFIILDGKVKMYTFGPHGKEVSLAYLSENQFFGETALMANSPRSATVQAMEETLLWELDFHTLREIMRSSPSVTTELERYHQSRLETMEAKKKAAGLVERRKHHRYNERLPVTLSCSPASSVPERFRGKEFQAVSKDLSVSGIRIELPDPSFLELPVGCDLRLLIHLPAPWGSIRSLGSLRNLRELRNGTTAVDLGIQFSGLTPDQEKTLARFLAT